MNAEKIEAMLAEDRAEWQALVEVLDAHPDEVLHDPESPGWTARDVYAHFARWMEHSTGGLELWLAKRELQPPMDGSDDEINARWQAEDAGLSLEEARSRAQEQFERRLRVVEAAPVERWDAVVEACARADGAQHYRGHRSYVTRT